MRLQLAVLGLLIGAGCGPDPRLVDSELPPDDLTFDAPDASDEGTGVELGGEEPDSGLECLGERCPEAEDGGAELDDGGPGAEADAGAADAGRPDGGAPDAGVRGAGAVVAPAIGSKFLVRSYTALRASPSATAALITSVDPQGGVHDADHGAGQPLGYLSPGQVVTLVAVPTTSGYHQVRYDGKVGWMPASRLSWVDPRLKPFDFALRPAHRNAFFKHQLHRSAWNKDGPYSSGTCAPTSLAIGARIFNKEPAGLSIEQSIHRARASYGVGTDHVGTNRYQIRQGAHALGLSVAPLDTALSSAAMLTRLAGQLALKRVVVLEGQPGVAGPATAYQLAFNRAYSRAGVGASYTFDGRHSIAVVGREADGGYVVADPISEVGMVTLTAAELKDFFVRWGGTGNAVWVP